MAERKQIAIESPFAGDVARNIEFCKNICRYAVLHGFNPYAMHLFFPQFLDDLSKEERFLGITCGLAWTDHAKEVWFCLRKEDKISPGMFKAIERNTELVQQGKGRVIRYLLFSQEGELVGSIIGGMNFFGDTVLQETDLYYSTSGKFEFCPCAGLKTKATSPALWVRPQQF